MGIHMQSTSVHIMDQRYVGANARVCDPDILGAEHKVSGSLLEGERGAWAEWGFWWAQLQAMPLIFFLTCSGYFYPFVAMHSFFGAQISC